MEKLLSIDEMAECLGMSKKTLYRWTHEGTIPFIKLGGSVKFKPSVVEAWLEKRARGPRVREVRQ